jgi:hypothetical protein
MVEKLIQIVLDTGSMTRRGLEIEEQRVQAVFTRGNMTCRENGLKQTIKQRL